MGRLAALTSNRVTRMGMASALGLGSVVGLGLAADARNRPRAHRR